MKQSLPIRTYKEGDEAGIFQLWQAMYPEEKREWEKWLRWWRWMYQDNPAGAGKIWLAEHEDRIVGHSAAIPVTLKIADEVITGFQSIDTMTHPSYRRQGIYEVLAKKVYTAAEKEGIHIGYRFPNEFSHPIAIKKLNWFDVATTQIMLRPLNWGNALRVLTSNKLLSGLCIIGGNIADKVLYRTKEPPTIEGLTITPIPSFDDRIDNFWDRVSSRQEIMVIRSRDFLNWRYVTIPDVDYSIYIAEKAGEIHGYIVLRCKHLGQTKTGVIFEILSESQEVAQCLISKAIEHCQQEEVDLAYCRMIANKTYRSAFRKTGFISIPFIKSGYFCAYSSSPYISEALLKNPENWFIQIGDRDAI